MSDRITRRDFINGVAIGIAGASGIAGARFAQGAAPTDNPTPNDAYPPRRTGMRGLHAGSFEVAHHLRDGGHYDLAGVGVDERYDLIVVGAGISGLAAAHYYRKRHPQASVLLLDTNDDFGGHAKRNEFEVDGRTLIGYGGTQSIDSPKTKWNAISRGLLTDLGIELKRFERAFDQRFYERWNLKHGVFFKREVFGADRLVRQNFGHWQDWDEHAPDAAAWRAYIDAMPLGAPAREQLFEMWTSGRDPLAGLTNEQRQQILEHTSYADFIRRYWNADPQILKFLQTRTHGLWAVGIDAVPAIYTLDLPGLAAQRAHVVGEGSGSDEPYIYHFPDGNASIARMLVRRLIPGSAPGHTMEDIVEARFDYATLDRPGQAVRLRLSSTAVEAKNVAGGVEVAYVRGGVARKAAARDCVLACYHAMMPYIAPEIGPEQAAAMHANVRAPLVYVNVIARHWRPWHQLGVAYIANPGGTFEAWLDFPVSLDGYRFSTDPSQPICIHLEHMPTLPNQGLSMREQFRAGRAKLYTTSFADFEREIRDELTRMLAPADFDFDRDITAITLNRWSHGYAYTPTPLYDDPAQQQKIERLARARVGRITIANSDSGWDAYTNVAIQEAHRAVEELASL